jgi:hypothetical protein
MKCNYDEGTVVNIGEMLLGDVDLGPREGTATLLSSVRRGRLARRTSK